MIESAVTEKDACGASEIPGLRYDRLLTVTDVAKLSGLSVRTVRNWVKRGVLVPKNYESILWLFRRFRVEEFVAWHRKKFPWVRR